MKSYKKTLHPKYINQKILLMRTFFKVRYKHIENDIKEVLLKRVIIFLSIMVTCIAMFNRKITNRKKNVFYIVDENKCVDLMVISC